MVYDLGGGTFDVTVVRYTPTHFRVLATDGDVMLGGHRLDEPHRRPRGRAVPPQVRRAIPGENPETPAAFTQECEDAKRQLSHQSAGAGQPVLSREDADGLGDAQRLRADDGRPVAADAQTRPSWCCSNRGSRSARWTKSCSWGARRTCPPCTTCSRRSPAARRPAS